MEEDWDYYEMLQLPRSATPAQIKKAYFRTAKLYHPDKNRGDPAAEALFKRVNEAHEVLSNPEKRALYDKHGKSALEQTEHIDLREVVKTVFGGGMFQTVFGDVSSLPMIELLFQQMEGEGRIAAQAFTDDKQWSVEQHALLKQQEVEHCEQLAVYLAKKMELHAQDPEMFAELIKSEALGLVETPGGVELLSIVGYIYTQEATQFLGGPSGWAAEVLERGHYMSEGAGIVSQVIGILTISKQLESQKDGQAAPQANKSNSLQEAELQKEVMSKGLDTVWRVGKLLLEERLRTVVELILAPLKAVTPGVLDSMKELLFTGGISETELDRKAQILLQIGTCWSQVAVEAAAEDEAADKTGFADLKRQVDLASKGAAGER